MAGLIAGGRRGRFSSGPTGSRPSAPSPQRLGRSWVRAPDVRPRPPPPRRAHSRALPRRARRRRSGPLAERVRVAPEDMRADEVGRDEPPARRCRARGARSQALWLADELTTGEFFVEFQPIFDLQVGRVRRATRGCCAAQGRDGHAQLAAEIFPAAESLAARAGFERFSWTCVLEAAERLPRGALLFLNVNPRLIERSEHALAALGDEAERRGVPVLAPRARPRRDRDAAGRSTSSRRRSRCRAISARSIALDDITSGYGTLQFCHALQPEWIKVDSEVTRGHRAGSAPPRDPEVPGGPRARSSRSTLIAEGIESAEDLDVCAQEGVGAAQGYFLARPSRRSRRRRSPEFRGWLAVATAGPAHELKRLGLTGRRLRRPRLPSAWTSGSTSPASFRRAPRPRRPARAGRSTSTAPGPSRTARSGRATASRLAGRGRIAAGARRARARRALDPEGARPASSTRT